MRLAHLEYRLDSNQDKAGTIKFLDQQGTAVTARYHLPYSMGCLTGKLPGVDGSMDRHNQLPRNRLPGRPAV